MLAVALVAAGAGVAVWTSGDGGAQPAAAASAATKTATIREQDLVETEEVDGTLGYCRSRAVVNRLSGTVTWVPEAGTVVQTNHRLYEVDGNAVYLLDGTYPAYRTLQDGLSGDDVRQFERNLRELDLDPNKKMQVDGVWDDGTTAAAKRWQKRKGMDRRRHDRGGSHRLPARRPPRQRSPGRGRRERRRQRRDDGSSQCGFQRAHRRG